MLFEIDPSLEIRLYAIVKIAKLRDVVQVAGKMRGAAELAFALDDVVLDEAERHKPAAGKHAGRRRHNLVAEAVFVALGVECESVAEMLHFISASAQCRFR